VVFDARKIKDEADYVGLGSPDASPAGLQAVIVNGVTVVREGQARENILPGKVLRQPNHPWTL
jgi:N-acyl-D-aspartate/D-glutamate deacylase